MVADADRLPLLVDLAASPQRGFFVRCLYLVVGNAMRSNFNTTALPDLEAALDRATEATLDDPAIAGWRLTAAAYLLIPTRSATRHGATGGWRVRLFWRRATSRVIGDLQKLSKRSRDQQTRRSKRV